MLPFPIVDTHLHIWDTDRLSYGWLRDLPVLNRPYLPADFRAASAGVGIGQLVFVQAGADPAHGLEEATWVAGQMQADPRIVAQVAWAPLEQGSAVAADLDRLIAVPGVRGIRRIIQSEPDPDFCLRPDFIAGARLLARYGLTFDICIDHRQMASAIAFARQCPDVPMVLDHIGKPDISAGQIQPWADQIRELAMLDHVYLKMSGVATEADHDHWSREDLRPFIMTALEAFGPGRTMFGGDWPVAAQAIAYPDWVGTLLWAFGDLGADDLRRIFRDTARSFYRLP